MGAVTSSTATLSIAESTSEGSPFRVWRFRFGLFHVFATYFLLIAGGMVTSKDAGLAVPDWPTTYGNWIFTPMIGNVFYEHGHRLIAEFVGLLTVIYAVWIWRTETRVWVKRMAIAMLAAVLIQGGLGGLTVLFYLPPQVSAAHGTLGQTFFCMSICTAYFLSREWQNSVPRPKDENARRLRQFCFLAASAVYLQLILGTAVRHAGMVLFHEDSPGFTLGSFFESFSMFVHLMHWTGALMVVFLAAGLLLCVLRFHSFEKSLVRPALVLGAAVFCQILLGLWTIVSVTAAYVATAHVVTGAFILGCCVFLTLRSYRVRNETRQP